MILLGVDTSGKNGSIALARATDHSDRSNSTRQLEILEVVPLAGGTFSAQLVPQISELLARHGLNKNHLSGFAVVSGPGSFTGLRVGLAAIKALAEVLQKPLAAVSLLEAIASSAKTKGKIIAALDAGRGEAYVGEYAVGERTLMRSERLILQNDLLAEAKGLTIVTPDAKLAEAARAARLQVEQIDPPRADATARLGWEKIASGELASPEELEANYIRRSDAEIFAKSNS